MNIQSKKMMNKQIDTIIRENLREFLHSKELLVEMPYSPKEYSIQCGVQGDIVYLHLAKLFLFGNLTRNADDWVNQIVDRHLVNMVHANYGSSLRSQTTMFYKGYVEFIFGKNFVDYENKMRDFCQIAIIEVQEKSLKLYNQEIKPLFKIEDAVNKGKNVVITLIEKASSLLSNNSIEEVRQTLKQTLKEKLQEYFDIEF